MGSGGGLGPSSRPGPGALGGRPRSGAARGRPSRRGPAPGPLRPGTREACPGPPTCAVRWGARPAPIHAHVVLAGRRPPEPCPPLHPAPPSPAPHPRSPGSLGRNPGGHYSNDSHAPMELTLVRVLNYFALGVSGEHTCTEQNA